MDTAELLWTVVFLLGSVQGLLLATVLLSRDASHKGPAVLLALLVVTFALMIGEELVDTANLYGRWPHAALSTFTLSLAIGPLILLYARRITDPARPLARTELLHFVPMLLVGLYMVPFYLLDGAEKLAAMRAGLGPGVDAIVFAKGLQAAGYQTAALILTSRLLDDADPTTRPHLKWYRRLLVATLIPVVYVHALHFFPELALFESADSDRIGSVILAVVIYAFALAAIQRPFFWGARTDDESRATGTPRAFLSSSADRTRGARLREGPRGGGKGGAKKYRTSPLDQVAERSLLDELLGYMESAEPYRDSELRLADVAAALGVSAHALSQTINELAGVNFYALMNQYRVDAVKVMMGDPAHDHRNLLALGFDAGFNSKTSFNRVFKQSTGLTPSAYRRRLTEAHRREIPASASS